MGLGLPVPLEVRPDLLWDEAEPGSDTDGRQLASFDEEIDLPTRDGKEPSRVFHRHKRCPSLKRSYVVRMAAHEFTLPPPQPPLALAEKSAHELCLRVVADEHEGRRFSATPADVDRSASVLFGFVQQTLHWLQEHKHGFGRGNERLVIELWEIQNVAFEAVAAVCPGGRARAKELQLEAGHDAPLTVCVGDLTPKRLPDRLPPSMSSRLPANVRSLADLLDPDGDFELNEDGHPYKVPTISWNTSGSGCKVICLDSVGTRRPGLRRWCRKCGSSSSARLEAEITSIKKHFKGSLSGFAWVEGRRVRVWPRTCSVCGRRFTTDSSNQQRCGDCFGSHRSVLRTRNSAPPSS